MLILRIVFAEMFDEYVIILTDNSPFCNEFRPLFPFSKELLEINVAELGPLIVRQQA